jgi:NTP pyrophosphatase (non-canonical NTP hydrolase)
MKLDSSPGRKPRVTLDNYLHASIDDFHEDFAAIWARDLGDRSAFDLWLHVVDHASRIARAVRRQRPPEVVDDLADTAVWLLSFIAYCQATQRETDRYFRFDESPSDIIWNKYPAICPACFDTWILSLLDLKPKEPSQKKLEFKRQEIEDEFDRRAAEFEGPSPCSCLVRLVTHSKEREMISGLRPELDDLRISYAVRLKDAGKNIHTMSGLEAMFRSIYANVHHVTSLETSAFHLLEEVGEATQALKDCYTYDDSREPFSPELHAVRKRLLLDELGDTLSWLFAITIKIQTTYGGLADEYRTSISKSIGHRMSEDKAISFADIVWAKYGMTKRGGNWDRLKCPGCQNAPCACDRDLKIDWVAEAKDSTVGTSDTEDQPVMSSERDIVFISYSHKDAEWLDRLQTMLKPLVRNKKLSTWSDNEIGVGQMWRAEIDSALSRAKVAVLLVSANFLASDFIADNELPPLLDAADKKGTKIVWIPVGASLYKETELEKYQAAHDPNKPLEGLSVAEMNQALVKICEVIKTKASTP